MTLQVELPEALYPIFKGQSRYRVAYGGRGSSKSWAFARMLLLKAYEKKRRILCARELQNSIKDSVHRLLSDQIELLKLPGFQIGESFLRHANGSIFIFKGLRANAQEIKSMEAVDIAWIEEAQAVSEQSWEVLIPTIRNPDSEIWVTLNPENKDDPTSQRFIENPPPESRITKINYWDNPWFPLELQKEMEYLRAVDPIAYEHVWEGEYRASSLGGKVVHAWSFANKDDSILYDPNKRVYLTCDFNVDPMCWAIAHKPVINGRNEYHFFHEIVLENSNIVSAAQAFAHKYRKHRSGIIITGDANSGRARSDMADEANQTRFSKIKQVFSDEGMVNFEVETNRSNPIIKTRLEQFNWIVCDNESVRRVKVHPSCTQIINICETARYIPGSDEMWQPNARQIEDRNILKFQRDDMLDAVSYLVWKYDPKVDPDQGKKNQKVITREYQPRHSQQ